VARSWRGEPPQEAVTGLLLWEAVWGWFQSSQVQGRTAEAWSSFVAPLVPGDTQAAGQPGLGSGQLKGTCSGENPGCNAGPPLKQELEDHHSGQKVEDHHSGQKVEDHHSGQKVEDHHSGPELDPLVCRSEAARRIPAEVGARRSGEEGCTGSQGRHCMANGGRSPGSWQ